MPYIVTNVSAGFGREHYETQMKEETTNKILTKKYHGKTLHGNHKHIYKSKTLVKINRR